MTLTEKQMIALLERRQEIDQMNEGSFTQNLRWLAAASELLLRHQLALHAALRDAGILR
jgi:hypothetical protein